MPWRAIGTRYKAYLRHADFYPYLVPMGRVQQKFGMTRVLFALSCLSCPNAYFELDVVIPLTFGVPLKFSAWRILS